MIKTTECEKICLKADGGKILYNERIAAYTPKAYLFAESESSEWVEVDETEAPTLGDEATTADYQEALREMGVDI